MSPSKFACAALSSLALVFAAVPAQAAPNKPSTAAQLTVGMPYSSTIDRRVAATEWLKLPGYMRPGDSITIASDSSKSSIRYCLIPAVDDFAQLDSERSCGGPGYTGKWVHSDVDRGKFRRTLEWTEPAGPGFLLVQPGCGACGENTWIFSVTVEQVITRVNIGMPTFTSSTRNVALNAFATLGDNTPVPDGVAGFLTWRSGDEGTFQPFAQATTVGGQLAFNGLLPPAAAGLNIQLAACINQIGGGEPRCAATQNVAIAPDPIPTLAASKLKLNSKRAVTAPLECAPVFAGTGCRGSIEIKTRRSVRFKGKTSKVRLARVRFAIPAGQTTGVKLTLARAQADLIRKVSRARAVDVIVKLDGKTGQTLKRVQLTR